MTFLHSRETAELEAERARLESVPTPGTGEWDRASWARGAMYALAWVINRRGAEVGPLAALDLYLPVDAPEQT